MVLALLMISISGCAKVSSKACPHLVVYSVEVQAKALGELVAMPEDSVVANVMMPDYANLRDQVRACQAS